MIVSIYEEATPYYMGGLADASTTITTPMICFSTHQLENQRM
eukprot:gene12042-20302_t